MQTISATLTIGDWSKDGHNQTEVVQVSIPEGLLAPEATGKLTHSNDRTVRSWGCSTTPNLWWYYQKSVKAGIPDITTFCKRYEQSEIPRETMELLCQKLGIPEDEMFSEYDRKHPENDMNLDQDIYPILWVAIVNYGIKLNGEDGIVLLVEKTKSINYNIGGYGLFSN